MHGRGFCFFISFCSKKQFRNGSVAFAALGTGRYNEYLRQDGVVLFPKESTFKAYRMFWQKPDVLQCFLNTIFISTVGTALNLFVTVLMAYALSKKDLVGRKCRTFFCLIPVLIPGGMVPTYLLVKDTGHARKRSGFSSFFHGWLPTRC